MYIACIFSVIFYIHQYDNALTSVILTCYCKLIFFYLPSWIMILKMKISISIRKKSVLVKQYYITDVLGFF